MPVRPLPEFLFHRGLAAVDLFAVGTHVLCLEKADAEIEPRTALGDRSPEILSYELPTVRLYAASLTARR